MENSIIYIRTSTDDQNPENQLDSCKKLSIGEYIIIEDKQSAFKEKDRKGFENAKDLIKKGKVNHFIAWDLDRIYRNRIKLKQFFNFCKLYNTKIHSVNQDWLEQLHKIPEPFNEIMHSLMLDLMGWLGEDESRKKSERVKLAIRKKDKGTYSYKGNRWGRKPFPKQTRDRVKELKQEHPDWSLRDIAKECYYIDKNGNKKQMNHVSVKRILETVTKTTHAKTP